VQQKNNPLISIIVPIYNTESRYLIQCIESISNQTYLNLEILLIDDKSTASNVLPILQDYKNNDNRIILIEKTVNEGTSFTRQHGIDIAKGEWLFFMDCDDYITINCIESLLKKASECECDMVIGDHWLTYESRKTYAKHDYDTKEPNGYLKALLTAKCGGTIWNKLIKTEKIKSLKLPNIHLQCNDVLVNFLIASENFKIECLGVPTYNWVQRENSITNSKSKMQANIKSALFIAKWVNGFIAKKFNPDDLKNEIAYYNLHIYFLILACWRDGMQKPYLSDLELFKCDVYSIYWRNKWAKKQLNSNQKRIIFFHKNKLLSNLYRIYKHLKSCIKF